MQMQFDAILKSRKLSLTSVRLAVLEALHAHPHSEASFIFSLVKGKISTASMQAVYNNLNTLAAHNIIREIKPLGRPSLYETRVGDNHQHIVCKQCQLIVDTDCSYKVPTLSPPHAHGFIIDDAEVILWGTCPACQKPKHKRKSI